MTRMTLVIIPAILQASLVFADGERDNDPGNVRRIPKLGVEVSDADRQELEAGLRELGDRIAQLTQGNDERVQDLLPDVEIYYRAVRTVLEHREFFAARDIPKGKQLLKTGLERAEQLLNDQAPWERQTGLVVRGYRSRIDHTVQPYGLVVPDSYLHKGPGAFRCDIWFHGRGETLSEVNFIDQRQKQIGRYAPKDTIVLHPYGRYSNAFKFAGETDVLEALESVRKRYRIDPNRISVRGFSMGGAACWQFAVHYADRWFAANPGAGFSETPEFLKFFQKETLSPTWYERKLWQLYDCNGYAVNLAQCPTVAYSGELDIQKQAADVMETALEKEGIDLVHIIGPKTKHTIHADSMAEIERRMGSLAAIGRQTTPRDVNFVTYTLKYNRMNWVTIDALGEHWKRARVDAAIRPWDVYDVDNRGIRERLLADPTRVPSHVVSLRLENVRGLTLEMPAGQCPFPVRQFVLITIAGQEERLKAPQPASDRSWRCRLYLDGDRWRVGEPPRQTLAKRHGLQGPIDDAFMDSFIFVKPSGQSAHDAIDSWAKAEFDHAVTHWRQQFRGDARVKADADITDDDIASANLVLWGDPKSNSVLGRIADRLPIPWTAESVVVGDDSYHSDKHAVIAIYPNPLNPERYVVLNSGFTYREYDYLNNARQVPKLPDWAIVDVTTPPDYRDPGKVVNAGFFDEQWQLKPPSAE